MPTAVLDLDAEHLPNQIALPARYDHALLLFRWKGKPVGQVSLAVRDGRISGDRIRESLEERSAPILQQWLHDYLECDLRPAVPVLPATVAVCTRDRPGDLSNCLVALSRLRDQGQEILVVDSASRSDETRQVVGPFYSRLVSAIREVDPGHIVFLDGNTYATEFDVFDERFDNAVYTLHDYVPAGLGRSPSYSREEAEQKFLQRSAYARSIDTPILVGEFGPIYTSDEARDRWLRAILADQLDLYGRHQASWTIWMYKDIGRQGLLSVRPETPYRRRFDEFVAKKNRFAADQWGSDGIGIAEVTQPVQDLVAREFPDFDPYPWGRADWVRTLLLNITFAQPLAHEYAGRFKGLDDSELDALADSFAFESCAVREPLLAELKRDLAVESPR